MSVRVKESIKCLEIENRRLSKRKVQSISTVGGAFALYLTGQGSMPSIIYVPLSLSSRARSNIWWEPLTVVSKQMIWMGETIP